MPAHAQKPIFGRQAALVNRTHGYRIVFHFRVGRHFVMRSKFLCSKIDVRLHLCLKRLSHLNIRFELR